jgi:hypothetical protein
MALCGIGAWAAHRLLVAHHDHHRAGAAEPSHSSAT